MLNFYKKRNYLSRSNKLIFARLFIGIGLAIIDTIWAIYLNSFGLSNSVIGFVSAFLVVGSLFFSLISTPIMEKYNEAKLLLMSIIASAVIYILIPIFHNIYIFIGLAVVLSLTSALRGNSFGIIFRDNIPNKELNKKEGMLYSIENIGWFVGPLIAAYFLAKSGISWVFVVAALFFSVSLFAFFVIRLKKKKQKRRLDNDIPKNIKSYFKNKRLTLPYLMSAGISAWWALIYIYVPLFMLDHGLKEKEIGVFLSAIIIPLIIIEYKIGKLSEKKGLKKFFIAGFFGLAILSFIVFFMKNIYIQLGLLIFASFFAGFLEPIQETFFFKRTSEEDEEKYYPVFGTSWETGSFISKIIIAGVLLVFIDKYAYLAASGIMLLFAIASLKIKEKSHKNL